MMRLNRWMIRETVGIAALAALLMSAGAASAKPDVDGAVDALIALPHDVGGDALGAVGLVLAAGVGATGDVLAVIDQSEYGRVLLRGFASTLTRRFAYGLSRLASGALEGFRNDDLHKFPEDLGDYLDPKSHEARIWTLRSGIGAAVLGATDLVTNSLLVLTRAAGSTEHSDELTKMQDDWRDDWVDWREGQRR
ncbi:MAG: hypothetical protein ACE5FG_01010 [Myxococcota bacterium]